MVGHSNTREELMRTKYFLILALAIASLAVLPFAVGASPLWNVDEAPDLSVDCDVDAGDTLSGFAEDDDPPVDVEAIWDDTLTDLSGSPQLGGFGKRTNFNFHTDPSDSGRTFTITATDKYGHEKSKQITVN